MKKNIIKYIIVTLMALGVGCASTNKNTIDEIIPNNDKLYDLLHITSKYAYKSVTEEDYKDEYDMCSS